MLLIVLPSMWLGFHTSALIAHIQLEISVLLSMQISYHALMICPFLHTFLEVGWRTSGVFGDLDPPLLGQPLVHSPCLLLSLIPAPALYCAVLVSRIQNKDVCPREVQPYLHMVPLSGHILFFFTLCNYQ